MTLNTLFKTELVNADQAGAAIQQDMGNPQSKASLTLVNSKPSEAQREPVQLTFDFEEKQTEVTTW